MGFSFHALYNGRQTATCGFLLVFLAVGCASTPCPPLRGDLTTDEELNITPRSQRSVRLAVDRPASPAPPALAPAAPSGPFAIFEQRDVLVLKAKCGFFTTLGRILCVTIDGDNRTHVWDVAPLKRSETKE